MQKEPSILRLCFAEFFGTFFFVAIGLCSVAVLVLGMSNINYPWMACVWGVAVTFSIYLVGGVSGAHINPAITISLALFAGFDKKKVAPYIISQICGAFCSACLMYALFSTQIVQFEAANSIVRGTVESVGSAVMFSTFPGAGVPLFASFLNEVFLTFLLVIVVYGTTDPLNAAAPKSGIAAIIIGATITIGGIASGPLSCFAMNPARDLGPRIFLMANGWGTAALGENMYGLIVPLLATTLGGILAGALYTKVLKPGALIQGVETP